MTTPTKKTTCESKGHFWQSSTSPFLFRCGRTSCKATRHYINGAWVETQPTQPKAPPTPIAQALDLWA